MRQPTRTCVATRQPRPQSELLRLVADEAGRVRVDLDGTMPGRGAWIQPQAELLARVEAKPRMLNRALRRKGLSARGLHEDTRQAVLQRLYSSLVGCHRAGVVVSGRSAVADASGLVAVIYAAGSAPLPELDVHPVIVLPLDAGALGRLLGRGPRCVVALRDSRPTRRLMPWLRCALSLG